MDKKIVADKNVVSDESLMPANIAWCNKLETKKMVKRSSTGYLDKLDKDLEGRKINP